MFLLKGYLILSATLLTKLKDALLPGGTSQDVFPVMEESAIQSLDGIFCAVEFLRDITCPRNVLAFSNKAFVSLCGFFARRERENGHWNGKVSASSCCVSDKLKGLWYERHRGEEDSSSCAGQHLMCWCVKEKTVPVRSILETIIFACTFGEKGLCAQWAGPLFDGCLWCLYEDSGVGCMNAVMMAGGFWQGSTLSI